MTYIIIAAILFGAMLLYFRLADHYNIIDKPNERSSHSGIIIRGGGVIFQVAVLLYFVFFGYGYPWFVLGVVLISVISFLDDIYTLSTKPRLAVHLFSVALLLYQEGIFSEPFYWWIIGFILIIGWINAFNFMDGINGITAFYSLAVLIPMAYINTQNGFAEPALIYTTIIAAAVLAFFNARKKARTFAGDVGSVSLAFIIAFLMVKLIHGTGHWEYIVLLGVYGVDAILTIVHRLSKRENIFKPHRSHLYQYMANERKMPHVVVSAIYGVLQLLVSFVVIQTIGQSYSAGVAICILLLFVCVYIIAKRSILLRLNTASQSS